MGEPPDRAALLVDGHEQGRVPAGSGRTLELGGEVVGGARARDVRGEEDHASDLPGPDPREQGRVGPRAREPGHVVWPTSLPSGGAPAPGAGRAFATIAVAAAAAPRTATPLPTCLERAIGHSCTGTWVPRHRPMGTHGRRLALPGHDFLLGRDVHLAAHEHALEAELVVEDDDVRGQADRSLPTSTSPSAPAGTAVAAATAAASGTPSACRFRTASIIVNDAAGEHALRPAHGALVHLDVDAAEADEPSLSPAAAIASVTSASRPAAARQATGSAGCEVDAVEDELHDDVVARERGTCDPGVAMQERPHRVEQVGDRARAAVERGVRLLRGRVAVAEGDGDAALEERVDSASAPGSSARASSAAPGRSRAAGRAAHVRVAAGRGQVHAEALGREERALEVGAEDPRAAAAGGNLAQRGGRSSSGEVISVGR